MNENLPIVVGVDGSTGSDAAVRYACAQAHDSGRPVELVHVPPMYFPTGFGLYGVPFLPPEFALVGREILAEAAELAHETLPAGQVTTKLLEGNRAGALNAAAEQAYELVLGADHSPAIEAYGTGSVVAGVAAGSQVPVVVVPEGWSATSAHGERIVVGIKDYERIPPELLRAAFTAARDLHATLDLVHVWPLPKRYRRAVERLPEYPAWAWNVQQEVARAIGSLADEYPEVPFGVTSVSGHPADVLRSRSEGAALLLLARRSEHLPHFGLTGHHLLRASSCPTEVVPVAHASALSSSPSHKVAV